MNFEMNLELMFSLQEKLMSRIAKRHKLPPINRIDTVILAFIVEIGECANEWRGFKDWSDDQEPRTESMLVEYVDGLHFILEIGLIVNARPKQDGLPIFEKDLTEQFTAVIQAGISLKHSLLFPETYYDMLFRLYMGLGIMLGFSIDEIESAYVKKNTLNHHRQDIGY